MVKKTDLENRIIELEATVGVLIKQVASMKLDVDALDGLSTDFAGLKDDLHNSNDRIESLERAVDE